MNDDLTWGIDLSGSPWPCIRLQSGLNEATIRDETREIPGPDLLVETGSLLVPSAKGDPGGPVLDHWKDLCIKLNKTRESIKTPLPDRPLIGVAYPRSMPPILRQFLPIVLGCEAATSGLGLPGSSPLVGIDAPVALILEALALREISDSGVYAVASGQDPSREWTAVTIENTPPSNPMLRGPILLIKLGRTAGSAEALGLGPETIRIEAVTSTGDRTQVGPGVRLPSTAIATGAARFARWRSLEFSRNPSPYDHKLKAMLLPGTPVVQNEILHPLGLIGHNGRESWFWRRLFDAGSTIPSDRVWLRANTRPPCDFFLAECLAPDFQSHGWLDQGDWGKASLRWHSIYTHSRSDAPPPPLRWSLELRDFNDDRRDSNTLREEVPTRWGLPKWISRIESVDNDSTEP
jgi:hypothetical protein